MNNVNNDQSPDYNSNSYYSNNVGFQNATALQIRLDTTQVVRQIEMYLKGERNILTQAEDGSFRNETVWKGKPIVSEEGLQGIMQFIETIFNPQVVQANFPDTKKIDGYEQYANFLCRTRMDIADHLMKNLYNYGIDQKNYNGLISTLMRFIEAFMSRALFNKERESYAATIRTNENVQTMPTKKSFGLPFFG